MKVKTTITFKVEYLLNLEFYDTDEVKALQMEKENVAINPLEIIDAYGAKSRGTFTTKVERAETLNVKEESAIKELLTKGWTLKTIAHKLRLPILAVMTVERKMTDNAVSLFLKNGELNAEKKES